MKEKREREKSEAREREKREEKLLKKKAMKLIEPAELIERQNFFTLSLDVSVKSHHDFPDARFLTKRKFTSGINLISFSLHIVFYYLFKSKFRKKNESIKYRKIGRSVKFGR